MKILSNTKRKQYITVDNRYILLYTVYHKEGGTR